MGDNAFRDICDRLSGTVDGTQFERFRWTRDEAPRLKELIDMVVASFADREDIDLAEEGGASGQSNYKRFIIKVHGQRIVALAVMYKDGQAILGAEPVERSPYTVTRSDPVHAPFEQVDRAWVEQALGQLIATIQRLG